MKRTVIVTDMRSPEAREAAAYLTDNEYEVIFVPREISLCDGETLRNFAEAHAEHLWGVIHPAPGMILGGIEEVTEEDWNRASQEGALASMSVTRVFGKVMQKNGYGSLIYLNSIHAEKPVGKGMLFSMSCAATQMICREAAQYYGQDGLRFFFVQRGITATDPDARSDVSQVYFAPDLRRADRKMPTEGDLNGLIAFLLTPEAACLNGSDLRADGGMTLYYVHRRKVEGREYFDPRKK